MILVVLYEPCSFVMSSLALVSCSCDCLESLYLLRINVWWFCEVEPFPGYCYGQFYQLLWTLR